MRFYIDLNFLCSVEECLIFSGKTIKLLTKRTCGLVNSKLFSKLVLPKLLKTTGCKLGIADCVLDILVPQIVLDGSRIVPLID